MALAMAGCSSGDPATGSSPGPGHARSGPLTLSHGRVPKPASPDVGAAYFTVTNASDRRDCTTAASSPAAGKVMAMTEVTSGGSTTMKDLPSLCVPAHGTVELTPGGKHLMLEHLTHSLDVGDNVAVTLTFEHAGTMHVTLPVVPISAGGQ